MRTEAYKNTERGASITETKINQRQAAPALPSFACVSQGSARPLAEDLETKVQENIAGDADQLKEGPHEPLSDVSLPAEADFYGGYRWCLNACPVLHDVVRYLGEELAKLDQVQEGWQQSEVITNIFLLSCSITDTLDDYLLGNTYNFAKLEQALPFTKPCVRILKGLVDITSRLRQRRLILLCRWKELWGIAVTTFLQHCFVGGASERASLLNQRDRLAHLLRARLPQGAERRRVKIPAFFRSRDFAPQDCLELGRKLIAFLPGDHRPLMVVGLRTAGSFLAPLLSAFLKRQSFDADWIAVRPSQGLTAREKRVLLQAARRKARMIIVDESIHSGQTLAQIIEVLRLVGCVDEDVIVLNPAEPAFPAWRESRILQSLPRIRTIVLDPAERFKHQLLEPAAVEAQLGVYFKARGYVETRVVSAPDNKQLNGTCQEEPPERVDVRLKRVYEVRLKKSDGGSETRYVLAKSVGWGWLSYHAFIAAQNLRELVPPVLGLRDGILYTEWIPQTTDAKEAMARNQGALIESLACYVAARARRLQFVQDPTPDLVRDARHKGIEMLSNALSRAYNSKVVRFP